MLNGVKKKDRMERTVDAIVNHADEFEYLFRELLKDKFKTYNDYDLQAWWELGEDLNAKEEGEIND